MYEHTGTVPGWWSTVSLVSWKSATRLFCT